MTLEDICNSYNNIVRIEGKSNYSIIHFNNNRKYTFAKVLSWYQLQDFSISFVRIHKSHLVNKSYIREVTKRNNIVYTNLINGEEIKASRRMRNNVFS